jgi:DmsE family decaheme c-type cytochrome
MKRHGMAGLALLLVIGLSPGLMAKPQQPPPPAAQPAPAVEPQKAPEAAKSADATAAMSCADCHDQAKVFGINPHAHGKASKGQVVPNAVCEGCHGNGTAHMEAGGDKSLIYKPVGVAGANKTCLGCHDTTTDRISRHTGHHANSAQVNCLTCHSIHSSEARAPHLLAREQLALCSTCHATTVASFRNKPYAHRLGRGGMECSSCHEPHGMPIKPQNLRMTGAGEMPCLGCHADKRGPFVFNHGSVAIGDCTTCHEVHGSSNPKMLKRSTVMQLCIECHSPITPNTLGSQPPSFHNLTTVRYQNCTSCHMAIHGSNRDPQLMK